MRRGLVGSAVVGLLVHARLAHADPAADADKLFREGNALAAAGNYADACPKLEASQKLDPAVGTEFNLADCDEHIGRTATAYALFLDVQKVAHAAGKFPRESQAQQRASVLAPKVPQLKLDVAATAPGLAITIDDAEVDPARWPEPIALDPGTHAVLAYAPNRTSWNGTVTVKDGETATLAIPELVDPNPPPPPAPAPALPPPPPPPPPSHTIATLSYVAAGVSVAGFAVGAIAGGMALSKKGSANDVCPSATDHFHCPTQAGADAWNSAETAGNVATVGFVVGGVALAAAVILWVAAPKAPLRSALTKPVWTF